MRVRPASRAMRTSCAVVIVGMRGHLSQIVAARSRAGTVALRGVDRVAKGSPMKVAFLGLGVMGFPMARHLAAGGHEVTVFNRTRARAESWTAESRGRIAATP